MIDKLADALKRGRVADLEVARYVYLLSNTDAGAAEINAELPKHGMAPLSKGYLSKLKTVYTLWCVERGKTEEELAPVGITKLYLCRKHPDLLEDALTLTDDELEERLKGAERDKAGNQPWKTLRLPESVYANLEVALAYMRDSTKSQVTMLQFVEIVSELIVNQKPAALLDLWKDAHGELRQ
jgi:hypothetical protein